MNKLLPALVSVARLVPHPFGASPIGAIAPYAGATGPRLAARLVPPAPLFGLLERDRSYPVAA